MTSMPGALSLRHGMVAKFSPPCFLKIRAFSTAISSSVSRQSAAKPGMMTAIFLTPRLVELELAAQEPDGLRALHVIGIARIDEGLGHAVERGNNDIRLEGELGK